MPCGPGGDLALEQAAFPRRIAGIPDLRRVPVAGSGPAGIPDEIRYSEFEMGAMVQVVSFPGDADPFAWRFQRHPMPAPRNRKGGGELRVPQIPSQTVSNRRRAQLAALDLVPPATLDIFEGTV